MRCRLQAQTIAHDITQSGTRNLVVVRVLWSAVIVALMSLSSCSSRLWLPCNILMKSRKQIHHIFRGVDGDAGFEFSVSSEHCSLITFTLPSSHVLAGDLVGNANVRKEFMCSAPI
jgi:hypothetical protein